MDFEKTWRPAYAACAERAGGDRAAELLELVGQDRTGRIDPRSPLACGTLDEIWDIWQEHADIDRDELDELAFQEAVITPICPLTPVFSQLTHLRLGMATMDSTRAARHTAQVLGLKLDFITGCDGGFGVKPQPGMVLGFCEAVGLSPAEVAMVGDTLHDLHTARAAGALAIAVTTGASPRELLEPEADVVLESVAQVPAWLQSRDT